ncbi:MAG: AMP-binding protein [Spirochaetales bacterium]|nr:AMP-binding protein [Spirochaetales bacterium]
MTDQESKQFVEYFLEPSFDFTHILTNLKTCQSRGIHIYEDQVNKIVYYPYSDIYYRAINCAKKLDEYGIKKGTYVLLSAQTDIQFIIVWLALILLGAIPSTLPPRSAFFSRDIYINRIREIIPWFTTYICYNNEVPYIEAICEERNHKLDMIIMHNLFDGISEDRDESVPGNLPLYDDTAFVQFTSGSMSTPKGVVITFRNLLNNIRGIFIRLKLHPEFTHVGHWLPLYHDMGLVGSFLLSLFTQTAIIMISPVFFMKRMFDFMRMISTYKIDMCCMTNSVLEIILHRYNEKRLEGVSLESLKWIGVGAEPVNITTLERFLATFKKYGLKENVLSPCYGLAESTLAVSISKLFEGYSVSTINERSFPTVGTVIEGTEVKIEYDEAVEGAGGVIKIKGDSVSAHSLVKGKKIKKTDEEGYYNTLDVGYFMDEKLVILGRADTMFIMNGENFFSHEIESLLIDSRLLQRPNAVCIPLNPSDTGTGNTELIVIYEVNSITQEEKIQLDEKLTSLVIKNIGLLIDKFIAVKRGSILYTTSGKIQYNTMRNLYLKGDISDTYAENS